MKIRKFSRQLNFLISVLSLKMQSTLIMSTLSKLIIWRFTMRKC